MTSNSQEKTTTKNKPKIVQNTMTNSCPQSHDDWRFMAPWLTGGRPFKKDQVERVRKHAAGIGDKIEMNGVGWSVLEAITLSSQSRWYEYCILYKWRFIISPRTPINFTIRANIVRRVSLVQSWPPSGAPNDGFLLNELKKLFRLFRVLLDLKIHSNRRYKIYICSVILGQLESFRNYQSFSIIFPKI